MTKPSDFTADRVLEVDQSKDTGSLEQHKWLSRGIGVAFLFIALGVIAFATDFPSASFFVVAAMFIGSAAYMLVSESRIRKRSLNVEKRLRLGLLVHNMELENMAMQDDLTQLFNRRYLFDRLERELETAKAFKRPLSLIIVDLNSMKEVNDTYGHRLGDELLGAFGRFLLEHTRASDVPARIGGDEFAVILPDTSEKAAVALTGRLKTRLDSTDIIDDGDARLRASASFGVSSYPTDGESVDSLMQRADARMYDDKHQRRAAATPPAAPEPAAQPLRLEQAEA